MKTKGILSRAWRLVQRILLVLVLAQFIYILLLRWVNPPFTWTMLACRISLIGTPVRYQHDWVDYPKISPSAKLAVISSEDQRFAVHHGFDFGSIEKAVKHNERSKHVHGASTISQQVARNIFLWQSRSWIRKGFEVYFTFMIEHIWGKKRILEVYLNDVQMGDGVFGIQAASRAFFHCPASRLSRSQAALIAATLPNPVLFRAAAPSRYVLLRQAWIQEQMIHLQSDPRIQALIRMK